MSSRAILAFRKVAMIISAIVSDKGDIYSRETVSQLNIPYLYFSKVLTTHWQLGVKLTPANDKAGLFLLTMCSLLLCLFITILMKDVQPGATHNLGSVKTRLVRLL